MSFHTAAVHTCCSLSGERCAHAAGVLSDHFNVVRGPGLQVVQSVRGHVAHEEIYGLVCAWKIRREERVCRGVRPWDSAESSRRR